MFESLVDKNFSIYLMRNVDVEVQDKDMAELMESLSNLSVNFATIDLGLMDLREFNKTHLADLLKKHEIPYFTVELPYYVKEHFSNEISEIKSKINELIATYNTLERKSTLHGEELKFLIDRYSKEVEEINSYINSEIRIDAIVKRILEIIKGRDNRELTFVHFGEENTFVEIMNRLKKENTKANAIFIQKSKFQ
jgi:tRNA(Ile)-lysidine synthase TilS/MesJ